MQLPGRKCPVFVRSKYHQSRPGIQIHRWKSPFSKIPDIISQMIPSQRNRGGVWISNLNPITKISVFIRQNRIIVRHKFRNNGARQSSGNREYRDVGKQILKINQWFPVHGQCCCVCEKEIQLYCLFRQKNTKNSSPGRSPANSAHDSLVRENHLGPCRNPSIKSTNIPRNLQPI